MLVRIGPITRVHYDYNLKTNSCRYDPNADISTDTDMEQDRVIFIKSVAQFMVSSLRIPQAPVIVFFILLSLFLFFI